MYVRYVEIFVSLVFSDLIYSDQTSTLVNNCNINLAKLMLQFRKQFN